MAEWTFIRDKHANVRGQPKMLRLICDRCNKLYGLYQKDGPGPLKRCYLDRFHEHPDMPLLKTARTMEDLPTIFTCPHCEEEIGMTMRYCGEVIAGRMTNPGEDRLAIKLFNAVLREEEV